MSTYALPASRFGILRLTLNRTSGRNKRMKPTNFFGDYTNQTIVYLRHAYDCLILKLAKILQSGNAYKKLDEYGFPYIDERNYRMLIKNLSYQDKQIENRKGQILEILRYKKMQKN